MTTSVLPLKKLGVYLSGGEASGMNAALRAVVQMGSFHHLEVVGIAFGYRGMLEKRFISLSPLDLHPHWHRGGAFLGAGRCLEFYRPEVRSQAAQNLRNAGVEALVCIGGGGSLTGGALLSAEHRIPLVGVPGTVHNDIYGTDSSIGFDTAVNAALQAIDRLRDTSVFPLQEGGSERLFIVEVLGKDVGFIAAAVGLASGAEEILTPEFPLAIDRIVERVNQGFLRGKQSIVLVTSEGQKAGRAYDLADQIRKKSGWEARVCTLGQIQRGGSPTAVDRILAGRLGAAAVGKLLSGEYGVLVGIEGSKTVSIPLMNVLKTQRRGPREDLSLAESLT